MSELEPMIAPFDPARFNTAVDYYVKHRIRYDPRLMNRLAQEARLDTSSRVLDLGCGPGFIANALAPRVGEATGLDPSEPMIAAARDEAEAQGRTNVTFRVGSSRDLDRLAAPFHLVAMDDPFTGWIAARPLRRWSGSSRRTEPWRSSLIGSSMRRKTHGTGHSTMSPAPILISMNAGPTGIRMTGRHIRPF